MRQFRNHVWIALAALIVASSGVLIIASSRSETLRLAAAVEIGAGVVLAIVHAFKARRFYQH